MDNSYGMRDDEIDLRQIHIGCFYWGLMGGEHGQNLLRRLFRRKIIKINIPGFNRVQVINSGTGGLFIQHYIQSFYYGIESNLICLFYSGTNDTDKVYFKNKL